MKSCAILLLLGLAACGGANGDGAANGANAATADAVTAEAVTDTRAAMADAAAAADAELDRLDNSIDDPAPANGSDRVSNTTAVTVY